MSNKFIPVCFSFLFLALDQIRIRLIYIIRTVILLLCILLGHLRNWWQMVLMLAVI